MRGTRGEARAQKGNSINLELTAGVRIPALPLNGFVAMKELPNLSRPQLPRT